MLRVCKMTNVLAIVSFEWVLKDNRVFCVLCTKNPALFKMILKPLWSGGHLPSSEIGQSAVGALDILNQCFISNFHSSLVRFSFS